MVPSEWGSREEDMTSTQKNNRALTRLSIALTAVALFVSLPAFAQDDGTPKAPIVTVVTAMTAEVVNRVAVSGSLVPLTEILIYPQVSGYDIQSINVDVGDTVQADDVLAELNSATLAAQLAQAEAEFAGAGAAVRQASSQIASAQASLSQLEAVLERSEQLQQQGTVSTSALDEAVAAEQTARAAFAVATDGLVVAQAQLQQAGAMRDVARLTLDQATIRAPADGLISARNGQVGAIAASGGDPIFKMISGGIIEIAVEVVETELGQIEVGDAVELSIAGLGQTPGVVRMIAPTVDPTTRLGIVRIETEVNPRLRTGLFASGWIVTDQHDALTVPATAVLMEAGGSYVLAVIDGALEKRPVTAGLIWQDRREILDGLAEDDVVVAKAGAFFADGDRVTPVAAETAPAEGDQP
jgi:HlyD family secretion protein